MQPVPKYLLIGILLLLTLALGLAGSLISPAEPLPRTEHGDPDLQGIWNYATLTPLVRPVQLGDKSVYSENEARLYEEEAARLYVPTATAAPDRPAPDAGVPLNADSELVTTDYDASLTKINGEYRTSLVIEPPDGRLPFLPSGNEKDIFSRWRAMGFGDSDGPEIRAAGERCLSALHIMPPMSPLPYNANVQIVQNKDYVMILGEMVHDARIIRLNTDHRSTRTGLWLGDSVGHWEGDTLVIHTNNFHPQSSNRLRIISSAQLEVTERFTRISENEIFYTYRVHDPVIYSGDVVVEMILTLMAPGRQMYEYACHEGNYPLQNILAGARRQEVDAELLP